MRQILLRLTLALLAVAALAGGPAAAQTPGDEHWDDEFGTPGIGGRVVYALAAGPDGSLYIGGAIEGIPGVPAQGIARWDGHRWHALGAGIAYPQAVRGIATHGGSLYAVGSFTSAGGVPANGVARWDGARWSRVGSGVGPQVVKPRSTSPGELRAVVAAPSGDIYVGGEFNAIDGVAASGVARWDGAAWHAVGGGLYSGDDPADPNFFYVAALALGPDGTLYAGGQFEAAAGERAGHIAAWDGGAWSTLDGGVGGAGLDTQVTALLFHGGRLYAAGYFGAAGGRAAANIAAWDGAGWAALGGGLVGDSSGDQTVQALLADGAGILAGGRFSSAGDQPIGGLARWDGAGWSRVGPEGHGIKRDLYTEVKALAPAPGGGFAAAGSLVMEDGSAFNGVARWTGEAWTSLGKGAAIAGDSPADIDAIAIDGAGRVYVGGLINYVGGAPVKNLAMWDGESWHSLGAITGDEANVYALELVGEELYVGGRFSQAGGVSARGIARYNISTGAWSALGAGVGGDVRALAYGDGRLYVGGDFDSAGGVEAREVAIWDGQAWSGLGGGFEIYEILDTGNQAGTYVNALAYIRGELYIGGRFQTIHDRATPRTSGGRYVAVHNIVSYGLNDQGWSIVGPTIHPGVTLNGFSNMFTAVRSLAYVGGALYVGGDFNQAGGVPAVNFARYNLLSGLWAGVGDIGGPGGRLTVRAVEAYGPDIFVGGTFTSIGGAAARFVARYNTLSSQWSGLGSGIRWYNDEYTHVNAIAVAPGGVYLGGGFDYAGPHPSLGFARWSGPLDPKVPPDPVGGGDPEPPAHVVYLPLAR